MKEYELDPALKMLVMELEVAESELEYLQARKQVAELHLDNAQDQVVSLAELVGKKRGEIPINHFESFSLVHPSIIQKK